MKLDFSNIRILVIGDFMLDRYTIGNSTRMSPEFPVPVILQDKIIDCPGGAGNVVLNLLGLGANVSCMGFVGDDSEGAALLEILKKEGADINFLKTMDGHLTTLKNRVISNNLQQLRIDSEKRVELSKKDFSNIISKNLLQKFDTIILSDYNKGVVEHNLFDYQDYNVIIDPKKTDFSIYSNSNIITPNIFELQATSKVRLNTKKLIINHCRELARKYNINHVVLKRGAHGMLVVDQHDYLLEIPGHKVINPDVTGAGDTVISILSLMMCITKNIEISSKAANLAASMVVSKKGTSTLSLNEFNQHINDII